MSSIYKVSITNTGGFYIGSTKNIIKRMSQHKMMLIKNEHHCKKLQNDFNVFGLDSFSFDVLLGDIPEDKARAIEYVYIQSEQNNPLCYNVFIEAAPPELVKNKISASLKEYYSENPHPRIGKKHSPETLAKIKENRRVLKGKDHHYFGKTRSEETKRKIGDAQRGVKKAPRVMSEEGKLKIAAAAEAGHYSHPGKKHTQESKDKMSKPILETTTGTAFTSLTNSGEYYNMPHGTIRRTIATGKPILKGVNRGLIFVYLDSIDGQANVNPNLKGERHQPSVVDYTNCTIEGCNGIHAARGLCLKHYKQSKRQKHTPTIPKPQMI